MDTNRNTLYWLAGLLEGEGSFSVTKPNGKIQAYPDIGVRMIDEDVIARVATFLDMSYSVIKPKYSNWLPVFFTHLRGSNAYNLARVIYPMMSKRRQEQIDKMLQNYRYVPNQKGANQNGA